MPMLFSGQNKPSYRELPLVRTPRSAKITTLKSFIPETVWDTVRKQVYRKASYRCQFCEGKGATWPVGCVPVWDYTGGCQKLVDLIALCPTCINYVKSGLDEVGIQYYAKYAGVTVEETKARLLRAQLLKAELDKVPMDYNIVLLADYGVDLYAIRGEVEDHSHDYDALGW